MVPVLYYVFHTGRHLVEMYGIEGVFSKIMSAPTVLSLGEATMSSSSKLVFEIWEGVLGRQKYAYLTRSLV